jgi:cyclophilin family peptidyl-prolyl cis-trans isomerase
MTWRQQLVVLVAAVLISCAAIARGQTPAPPIVVVETVKGTFAFETFPKDAPKTVAHIIDLVRRGFYDGQRTHRAQRGFIVQFGDPQTRSLAGRDVWGRGAGASSGTPIGIAEMSPTRLHDAGAIGVAHMGNPAQADSQIYVTLAPRHELDGQYVVFAHVIEGQDVPALLEVGDEILRVYVRE